MPESRAEVRQYDPSLAEALREGEDDRELSVLARVLDPAALPPGVRVVTRFGDVMTLRVRPSHVVELAENAAVVDMERSLLVAPSDAVVDDDVVIDDDIVTDQPADDAPSYARRPAGLVATGRGVVVAVLDWGCDFAHPAFRHADGSTRLLALWDQRADDDADHRWGYGRIHDAAAIDRALRAADPYAALGYHPADAVGGGPVAARGAAHGTHVLDIAAGNGQGGGMSGVAPDAALVFVHLAHTADTLSRGNLGDSASVLEALDFAFGVAGDRPCVVNMSVGAHGGPHDGTTLVEQGIDRALWLAPGRAVCNSVGNYAAARAHRHGRVPAGGDAVLPVDVPVDDATPSELEIWYAAVDLFTVAVVAPDGAVLASVAPGAEASLLAGGRVVGRIYHVRAAGNGDHLVDLFLYPYAPGGPWELRLHGDRVEDGRFHAWVERERGRRPHFHGGGDVRGTTGTLCNGHFSIAIGAYDPRRRGHPLARFSSGGPTRDGRVKPEHVAPGVNIVAARSTPAGEAPGARYTSMSGTSMAAPHATGLVAVLFEAAGTPLDISDTRALLLAGTSREDASVAGADVHRFGNGYLDPIAVETAARRWANDEQEGESMPTLPSDTSTRATGATAYHPAASAADGDGTAPHDERADAMPGAMPDAMSGLPDATFDALADAPFDDAWSRAATEALAADVKDALPRDLTEVFAQARAELDAGPSFDDRLLASGRADVGALRTRAAAYHGRDDDGPRTVVAAPGTTLDEDPRAGDLLVRAALTQGVQHVGIVVSSEVGDPAALVARGVDVEAAGPGRYVAVAEATRDGGTRIVGRRLTDAWGRMPWGQSLERGAGAGYAEDDPARTGTVVPADPLAAWVADDEDLVVLVGTDRVFVLPSGRVGTIVPPARLANVDWNRVILERDLGPLLGLPPVGAGASRIFKAGPRLAVMVDAGRNPQRQTAAVYLDHVAARMRDLGVTEIRAVILIHRHADHANELPRIIRTYNVAAANVIMPRAYFQQQDRNWTATVAALQQVFGARWQPADLTLRPASPRGDLLRATYSLGELRFEFLADAAALRLRRHTDAASLLTRVTRRGEEFATVVLGDLRGADMETFHRLLGPDRWREFFRDVRQLEGFSHHRGAIEARDVPGLTLVLEETLLRTGRLRVTLQTDPGQHVAARGDTLEFMRRIGIEVVESHVATTSQPSGVRGTGGTATATGPHAQTHQPIASPLVAALGRIQRLHEARTTVELWGPEIARRNPQYNVSSDLRLIDSGLAELRGAVRTAVQAALTVRVAGAAASGGGRDYASGTAGTAFAAAVARIPATTATETTIGDRGFAELLRRQGVRRADIPLHVELHDALVHGRFSRRAFQYMIAQLDPATVRSIFAGPRGGRRGLLEAFQRVRAEFGFRQQALAGTGVPSAAHLRPGARGGARVTAGVLALVEIGNLVAQGVQSYRVAQANAQNRNVVPFLRRIAFWRQLRAQSAEVAVDEGFTSNTYERDAALIDQGLQNGTWDYLYIEHVPGRPALADTEIMQAMAVLGYQVRNYDEYATLFEDSAQDALRWDPGSGSWASAKWEVHVGNFVTAGLNSLVDFWVELPLLTDGMRALTARVVQHTDELLALLRHGQPAETVEKGTLQHPSLPWRWRARLRPGVTQSALELRPSVPAQWGGQRSTKVLQRPIRWGAAQDYEFFVWDETPTHLYVSGASWPAYVRLRDLRSERYQVGSRGNTLNALYTYVTGNELADGWIPRGDVVRI